MTQDITRNVLIDLGPKFGVELVDVQPRLDGGAAITFARDDGNQVLIDLPGEATWELDQDGDDVVVMFDHNGRSPEDAVLSIRISAHSDDPPARRKAKRGSR